MRISPIKLSRRSAVGLLLTGAVLPPVLGASTAAAEPQAGPAQAPLPDALRRLAKPNLEFREVARISNQGYRITFHEASWDAPGEGRLRTVVRDLAVATPNGWVTLTDPAHRFDEQWVVFTGEFPGGPAYYYGPLTTHWVAFDSVRKLSPTVAELRAGRPGHYDLVVRWNLDHELPALDHVLTAGRDDHYLVGYQSFDTTDHDHVDEVLCGALQHAKVVYETPNALSAWELFTPAALLQRRIAGRDVSYGVFVPGDVMAFQHERQLGPHRQPYGMSLRNDDGALTPVAYAPHVGELTPLKAGQRRGFSFGVIARPGSLYQAYEHLLRTEYDYRAYRQNVYDTSLTDTVHNITDLIGIEPDGDDADAFVPSFSGWWNRAKGFIDVENDQCVRTSVAGVLLGAHYLTHQGDDDLYQRRARQLLEYQLSRKGIGYTPIKGKAVYGDLTQYRVGQIPGDTVTLNGLDELTLRRNAGLRRIGRQLAVGGVVGQARHPFSVALAAAQLTGDDSYLEAARLLAERYIADEIDTPYTAVGSEVGFGYNYCRYWADLLILFEATGDERFLAAAYREAKRFVTQTEVRVVPGGTITVPQGHVIDSQFDWPDGALPDYPGGVPEPEQVPAWMVSTSGLTFEQLSTFKVFSETNPNPGGGFVLNPCWAPFLLRLAHYVDDDLLADIADNLVVGRFTTYPGYYNRQFLASTLKPEFAVTGPPGLSGIYFHHAPAQLGLAMDYLFSEHFVRSGGKVAFPGAFEANFVYFKFSVYGHRPGTFHGEEGVWPYLPKGLIKLDNPLINWLTGVGNDSLYVSLTNSSTAAQQVTVDVGTTLIKVEAPDGIEVVQHGNGTTKKLRLKPGQTTVTLTVPRKGQAALIFRKVTVPGHRPPRPSHQDHEAGSSHSQDTDPGSDFGLARGQLLVRPDLSGYDAYVQFDTETPTTLRYRVGDGPEQETPAKPFPYEWTIGVDDPAASFTYRLVNADLTTDPVTLRLPPAVTLITPAGEPASGEVEAPASTVAGGTFDVVLRIRNAGTAPLAGLTYALTVPDGWTSTPGDAPATVPGRGTAEARFKITAATGAAFGDVTLTGRIGWPGGELTPRPATVAVRDGRGVISLKAEPEVLAKPGDSVRLTARFYNAGPVATTGRLTLGGQPGWTIENSSVTVQLPPKAEAAHTFVSRSPVDAMAGGTFQFRVRLDDVHTTIARVKIADAGIIVHNETPYPAYRETGEWLPSSLAGWNQIRSRYSAEGLLGGTARWTPDLPADGEYDVAVWYPSNNETTTAAVYLVRHAEGTTEVVVDQRKQPNSWFPIGRYRFAAGTEGAVTLEVRNPGYHRASAARFLQVE